jgi:hypothetical protein
VSELEEELTKESKIDDKTHKDSTEVDNQPNVEQDSVAGPKATKKEKREKRDKKKDKKAKHEEKIKTKESEKKDKSKRKVAKSDSTKPKKPSKKLEEDFFVWAPIDDNTILEAKTKFGPNWELISDVVNSLPRPVPKRCSRRQCFEHWKNALQAKEEPKEIQKEPIQFSILEIIKRTVQKKKQIPGDNMLTSSIPTDASHAQAAMAVKSRNPIEIATNALLKLQRLPKEHATGVVFI